MPLQPLPDLRLLIIYQYCLCTIIIIRATSWIKRIIFFFLSVLFVSSVSVHLHHHHAFNFLIQCQWLCRVETMNWAHYHFLLSSWVNFSMLQKYIKLIDSIPLENIEKFVTNLLLFPASSNQLFSRKVTKISEENIRLAFLVRFQINNPNHDKHFELVILSEFEKTLNFKLF